MRLEALQLAVQYITSMPAASQRSAEMVVDTAKTFMIFLKEDDAEKDNPVIGPRKAKSKTLNLSGQGQSQSGPQ